MKLSFEPTLSNFWAYAKSSSGAEKLVSVVKREDGSYCHFKGVKEAFRQEFLKRWDAESKPLYRPAEKEVAQLET